MNQVIAQLSERRSVRAFTDESVSAEDERSILEAACQAPTAGNQQLYSIIVVRDQAKKDALAITCDHQDFIATAPLVLVFCADVARWYRAFLATEGCDPRETGVGDLMLAVEDATIAAQNAVVAAESYGIGSCYIGDIMENIETQREILGLPEHVFPAAMLVFGYPTEGQKLREKPQRAGMEYIVHENRYREMDGAQLRKLLGKGKNEAEYREWMAAFCKRKYNSDFAREMSRSVREYLKQYDG